MKFAECLLQQRQHCWIGFCFRRLLHFDILIFDIIDNSKQVLFLAATLEMALKQTEKLKENVEEQLERLVKQLEDLEKYREDFEPEEYQETKTETLEQMREFQSSLAKLAAGDLSLTDYFAAIQLGIQAALSQVFRTPEVILMFAKKQPEQLRLKLAQIQRDLKLGKLSSQAAQTQQVEVLGALKGLGEILSTEEANILEKTNSASLQQFIKVSTDPESKSKLLALAENSLSLQ
ncbi:protein LZIC-like [Daphnia pulicaria]|uniref:protein LZIC-like n=1 Tax=Daphnia pulicaria TaxID=35523 RepID=UPI001EEB3E9F|nr:protein LZIC-like [Daphnia pulicaria]